MFRSIYLCNILLSLLFCACTDQTIFEQKHSQMPGGLDKCCEKKHEHSDLENSFFALDHLEDVDEDQREINLQLELNDLRNSLDKQPKIKLLERLLNLESQLTLEKHQEFFLRLMQLILNDTPKTTLLSYQSLQDKVEPFKVLLSYSKFLEQRNFKSYQQALKQWREKYQDLEHYIKYLPEYQTYLASSLVDFEEVFFVSKQLPAWFDQFVCLFEQKFPDKKLTVSLTDDLKVLDQKKDSNRTLILSYGFDAENFNSYAQKNSTILLLSTKLEQEQPSQKNLWIFQPAHLGQYTTLREDLLFQKAIVLLEPEAFEEKYLKFLKKILDTEQTYEVSLKNYQKTISDLLKIPSKEQYFQKLLGAQVHYHPLAYQRYEKVFLLTSPQLARLSYPYWRLKSQAQTKFYGLSDLIVQDQNLDKTLKGLYISSSFQDYSAQSILDLLERLPDFVLKTSYTLQKDDFHVHLDGHLFIQESSFQKRL